MNKSSEVAGMGDRLATIDMSRKVGRGCCRGAGSPLDHHLTQCALGRGLPILQVASMDAPHWQDFRPLCLTDCNRCWMQRRDSSMDDETTTMWRHCFVSCTGCECQNASPSGWRHLRIAACQHNMAPHYLAVQLHPASSVASRQRLRSASTPDFIVPHTSRSTVGDRAFCVTAARAWNTLTPSMQSSQSQSFDFGWRLNCSRAPFQINYISERSMLRDSVYYYNLEVARL